MVQSVISINIDKYNIFHRPDEAMLFFMVKACLCLQNMLSFRTLKEFFLIIIGLKQNDELTCISNIVVIVVIVTVIVVIWHFLCTEILATSLMG